MRRFKHVFLPFCFLMLSSTAAFASGDGHDIPWGNFAFRVANLIVFGGLIYYFWGKKIVGFFRGRTASIANEISTLEQRKIDAQEQLSKVEASIASLDEERNEILAAYERQGELLKAEIIANAEKAARQITEQAKVAAENEIAQAVSNMRSQLADEIISAAEDALAKKLTPAEQAKLVDKYLTRVVFN